MFSTRKPSQRHATAEVIVPLAMMPLTLRQGGPPAIIPSDDVSLRHGGPLGIHQGARQTELRSILVNPEKKYPKPPRDHWTCADDPGIEILPPLKPFRDPSYKALFEKAIRHPMTTKMVYEVNDKLINRNSIPRLYYLQCQPKKKVHFGSNSYREGLNVKRQCYEKRPGRRKLKPEGELRRCTIKNTYIRGYGPADLNKQCELHNTACANQQRTRSFKKRILDFRKPFNLAKTFHQIQKANMGPFWESLKSKPLDDEDLHPLQIPPTASTAPESLIEKLAKAFDQIQKANMGPFWDSLKSEPNSLNEKLGLRDQLEATDDEDLHALEIPPPTASTALESLIEKLGLRDEMEDLESQIEEDLHALEIPPPTTSSALDSLIEKLGPRDEMEDLESQIDEDLHALEIPPPTTSTAPESLIDQLGLRDEMDALERQIDQKL